jgi:5-methylcytosine-specific restriction endonuclease McrA
MIKTSENHLVSLDRDIKEKFGDVHLSIELVPKTCWFSNVRDHVSQIEWDKLRKASYKKANYVCEICGNRGESHPVECHEIWNYDDEHFTQTLKGLISLCPNCHEVKHIGLAGLRGRGEIAKNHLAKVNKWSNEVAEQYINLAKDIFIERSKYEWNLNFEWLTKEGVVVKPKR